MNRNRMLWTALIELIGLFTACSVVWAGGGSSSYTVQVIPMHPAYDVIQSGSILISDTGLLTGSLVVAPPLTSPFWIPFSWDPTTGEPAFDYSSQTIPTAINSRGDVAGVIVSTWWRIYRKVDGKITLGPEGWASQINESGDVTYAGTDGLAIWKADGTLQNVFAQGGISSGAIIDTRNFYVVGSHYDAYVKGKRVHLQGYFPEIHAIGGTAAHPIFAGVNIDFDHEANIGPAWWDEKGKMTALPLDPGYEHGEVWAISPNGDMVGDTSRELPDGSSVLVGCVWKEGRFYDLNTFLQTPGFIDRATGINASGQIAATGSDSQKDVAAYIFTPQLPPPPVGPSFGLGNFSRPLTVQPDDQLKAGDLVEVQVPIQPLGNEPVAPALRLENTLTPDGSKLSLSLQVSGAEVLAGAQVLKTVTPCQLVPFWGIPFSMEWDQAGGPKPAYTRSGQTSFVIFPPFKGTESGVATFFFLVQPIDSAG